MVYNSPFPSVPVCKTTLDHKIFNAILHHIDEDPNKIAMIKAEDPTKFITFKEIYFQSLALASFLSKHDFGHEDVLCIVLPNCFEYSIAYLAAMRCGGAISGASAMFTDYELQQQFTDSGTKVVFTDAKHLEKVRMAAVHCPLVKVIICITDDGECQFVQNGLYSYKDTLKTDIAAFSDDGRNIEDLAILPYSSGTTGSPKGVMLSHKNFGTMMDVVIDHYERVFIPRMGKGFDWLNEHVLLMLPFYHIYGFGNLNQCLLKGVTGIVFDHFDPVVFLQSIQRYKVRILMLVPPIVLFLAKHELTKKYDLSSMEIVITGAAPCGKELCEEFYKKYKNIRFLAQAYGLTECGMACHLPVLDRRENYTTVGHVAANFEQKMVDPVSGREVKQGERGEICVRGPTVMKGYLNRKEATDATIDFNGWLHTGDIGYQDESGQTFIVDRLKELIKVKGLQVPPAELEDLLLSHPLIADAAVIGLPDEKVGERPKAFVVRKDNSLTEEEVQNFVKSKVSSYKFLTGGVEFIEQIPKSPAGKILRRFLRDQSKAKL